jgi:hypothetical protein
MGSLRQNNAFLSERGALQKALQPARLGAGRSGGGLAKGPSRLTGDGLRAPLFSFARAHARQFSAQFHLSTLDVTRRSRYDKCGDSLSRERIAIDHISRNRETIMQKPPRYVGYTCATCGKKQMAIVWRGPGPTHCPTCARREQKRLRTERQRLRRERNRLYMRQVRGSDEPHEPRPCAYCGQPFTPERSTGQHCSTKCRVAAHRQKRAAAAPPPPARKR